MAGRRIGRRRGRSLSVELQQTVSIFGRQGRRAPLPVIDADPPGEAVRNKVALGGTAAESEISRGRSEYDRSNENGKAEDADDGKVRFEIDHARGEIIRVGEAGEFSAGIGRSSGTEIESRSEVSRPYGTGYILPASPALKRRAIFN